MKQIFAVSILFVLVFAACGPKGNVYIDNGGEETLTVVLDQSRYDLQPGQRSLIEVEPGPHQIRVAGQDGKFTRDTTVQIVEGGLINPAGAEFLVWKEVFAPNSTLELRKQLLKPEKLKIDNFVYEIEFTSLPSDQLYIEKSWDFGLNESFPKTVQGWEFKAEEQYKFKTLLVRKSDFAKVYMEAAKP
jgi:hypothetical protein